MNNSIVRIASDLIKFPTVAGRTRARQNCTSYIENFFRHAGIPVSIWEPGDQRSLLAKLGEGDPLVTMLGHYDVVDGPPGSFRPRLDGDRLFGRGAADMKTSLAAMMLLLRELAQRPRPPSVALMITGDEETGGERGAGHILKCGFKTRFAVSGEPSGLAVANQAKGLLCVELSARGTASHSARPWQGDNAIFSFFRQFPAVWEIFGDPEPDAWQTTMVPAMIRAGEPGGRVPDLCACRLDIRYVAMDRPDELVERIRRAAPELTVEVVGAGPVFYTDPQDPYLNCLRRAAQEIMRHDPGLTRKHATTDTRHFSGAGIPAAVFGPRGDHIHGAGEWVDLRQVAQFYKTLEKFIIEAQSIEPVAPATT